jgi:truncated hemoglobin YjbI
MDLDSGLDWVALMEELLEAEAVEEPTPGRESEPQQQVRHLPEPVRETELDVWRGEMKTAAIAAAGGLVAGVATVAMAKAARGAGSRRAMSKAIRRQRRDRPVNVIASRSFLVDVHVLGR